MTRTMLAAIAILVASAIPVSAAGLRTVHAVMRHAVPAGGHLTVKQRRWFGSAVEHILRGVR